MSGQGIAPTCLSIQSAVVAGHVGHGASAPALALMGVEVWPLPTVTLSGHAATPGVEGRRATGAEVAALGRGLAASGALARCDALLTGYLGTAEAAEAAADIAAAWRAVRPGGRFVCDPVLGDAGRLYLPEAVGRVYLERLLPLADVATPNPFELGWLTGLPARTPAELRAAAAALLALGPRAVVVTSAETGRPEETGLIAATAEGTWLVRTPRAPGHFHGAGDLTAALILAALLDGADAAQAASRAASAAFALVEAAGRLGREDLPVIAARAAWRAPARRFAAESLG